MNLQEQISRMKSMMGLLIEEKHKSNKPIQIFSDGGGSNYADKYEGQVEKIPVKDTVRNEPFKDMSYMKEKGQSYIDALNNGEEWMNKPIVAIVHPYDSSKYVVVDGNHRIYAYKETNTPEVNAIIVPHEDVVLMKSQWGDENEESVNLTDVLGDNEMIDRYFVKPDGTNSFKSPNKEEMKEGDNRKVKCECGWSWKLEDGGDDPYTCHKCGKVNSKEELTEKCWPGYTQKGMKTMFGKRYPNCIKKTKK